MMNVLLVIFDYVSTQAFLETQKMDTVLVATSLEFKGNVQLV